VFRPTNGLLYFKNQLTTGIADYQMVLGIPGDVGLAGNWNGGNMTAPVCIVRRHSSSLCRIK